MCFMFKNELFLIFVYVYDCIKTFNGIYLSELFEFLLAYHLSIIYMCVGIHMC